MKYKAIYSLIENRNTHYFYTDHAGGFSHPFTVFSQIGSMKSNVNRGLYPGEITAGELMPLLKSDHHFEKCAEGQQLFTVLDPAQAAKMLDGFAAHPDIPAHITLDLDNHQLRFAFSRQCQSDAPRDFSIPYYQDGSRLIRAAYDDGLRSVVWDRTLSLEDAIEQNMEQALRLYSQRQAAQMEESPGMSRGRKPEKLH